MIRSSMRLVGACAAVSFLAFLPVGQASAHWDDAYYHDYDNLPSQSRWMATLDDATPLNRISLPGTHGSAARHGGWITENQTLTIPQQLDAGVRFLDLRARHIDNTLALHHGPVFQYQMFGDALNAVATFLAANPTETVFVRIKDDEHTSHGNSRHFVKTLDSYFPRFGKHFAVGARFDHTLGSVRGKAVLLRNYGDWDYDRPVAESLFKPIDFKSAVIDQDLFHLGSNWDLYWKWERVRDHIFHANHFNGDGNGVMPFVNFLSGSDGAFPYFVASGHSDPGTGAPGLATGKATPFFNDWPDFPRGSCFGVFCTIYFEGTNTLTKNALRNPGIRYAGIVAADFPGAGLIQAVIDVNRTSRPMVSANNGQCLDIEGGLRVGGRLITWACHGGTNQRFTVRGDRIMVGTLCLDVEGGRNIHKARVLAWSCHGGQNQRWKLQNDGTIRSLLPGTPRCLDLIVEEGNRVGLWDCYAPSPDQQFRTQSR